MSENGDRIWEALSNGRRRRVLRRVADAGATTKSDLAEHLAAQEAGENYDSMERKRVLVPLHQIHLDKLHEAGLIRYREGRAVEPTPLTPGVVEWMEQRPWGEADE